MEESENKAHDTLESNEDSREKERKQTPEREMFKAVCSKCDKECEVPFKPDEGKKVYCKDCYKPKRFDRGDRGNNSRGRFQRRLYDAVCAKCKKKCQVPFRPREGADVLCRECYSETRKD
jgi:CxxC-x17-CxxC domain-containing protein